MANADILTIVTATGVLIAAIGAVVVNIIVALKTTSAIKENTAITSSISAKADVITGHVNSASTLAAAKIEALTTQVMDLKKTVDDQKQTAALLAQSAIRPPNAQQDIKPIGDLENIRKIEENTKVVADSVKEKK